MAPIDVRVNGQYIGRDEIESFISGYYEPKSGSPKIETVVKSPSAMPPDAPYASYQGREPGPPSVELLWVSSTQDDTGAANEQYVAAAALAVMDAGNGGPSLQAVYAKTPSDRASRQALGVSFARAFEAASSQSAAVAAAQAQWIRSNLPVGMPRAAAYELLKSRGLVAYNFAFIKGEPIPPSPGNDGGCDTTDWSSAAWPYNGEPLPPERGGCADVTSRRPRSIPNPDAELELSGAFNVACGWTTDVTVSFDRADRVKSVEVDRPRSVCPVTLQRP